MESQLTISPPMASAIRSASSDLPVPVGPAIAIGSTMRVYSPQRHKGHKEPLCALCVFVVQRLFTTRHTPQKLTTVQLPSSRMKPYWRTLIAATHKQNP